MATRYCIVVIFEQRVGYEGWLFQGRDLVYLSLGFAFKCRYLVKLSPNLNSISTPLIIPSRIQQIYSRRLARIKEK